jgi:hypothetical protein
MSALERSRQKAESGKELSLLPLLWAVVGEELEV